MPQRVEHFVRLAAQPLLHAAEVEIALVDALLFDQWGEFFDEPEDVD